MYKKDLALDDPQWSIRHKTKRNQFLSLHPFLFEGPLGRIKCLHTADLC